MIVGTITVQGIIIIEVLIGITIPAAMVIVYTVKNNVPVTQIAVPLNAEMAIASGGKLDNALQNWSELQQIIIFEPVRTYFEVSEY